MEVQVTWHLIVMVVLTIVIISTLFKGTEDLGDFFSSCLGLGLLIVVWAIYGGIFWW